MATIWIAIISALGVIVASLIQWRSNVATIQSATNRTKEETEARERQLEREQDERAAIRAEARDDAVRAKRDEQHAQWRVQRQELHGRGVELLQSYLDAANLVNSQLMRATMMGIYTELREDAAISDSILQKCLESSETALLTVSRDVQLIAGHDASLAFVQALSLKTRHSRLVYFLRLGSAPVRNDEHGRFEMYKASLQQIEETLAELTNQMATYVAHARNDLGA